MIINNAIHPHRCRLESGRFVNTTFVCNNWTLKRFLFEWYLREFWRWRQFKKSSSIDCLVSWPFKIATMRATENWRLLNCQQINSFTIWGIFIFGDNYILQRWNITRLTTFNFLFSFFFFFNSLQSSRNNVFYYVCGLRTNRYKNIVKWFASFASEQKCWRIQFYDFVFRFKEKYTFSINETYKKWKGKGKTKEKKNENINYSFLYVLSRIFANFWQTCRCLLRVAAWKWLTVILYFSFNSFVFLFQVWNLFWTVHKNQFEWVKTE